MKEAVSLRIILNLQSELLRFYLVLDSNVDLDYATGMWRLGNYSTWKTDPSKYMNAWIILWRDWGRSLNSCPNLTILKRGSTTLRSSLDRCTVFGRMPGSWINSSMKTARKYSELIVLLVRANLSIKSFMAYFATFQDNVVLMTITLQRCQVGYKCIKISNQIHSLVPKIHECLIA